MTTSYWGMLQDLEDDEFLLIRARAIRATISRLDRDKYLVTTHLEIEGGEMQPGLHVLATKHTVVIMGRLEDNIGEWAVCRGMR